MPIRLVAMIAAFFIFSLPVAYAVAPPAQTTQSGQPNQNTTNPATTTTTTTTQPEVDDRSFQVITAQEMLANITRNVPSVERMVTAFAYVLGFYFMIAGIIKLKHMGEMRTQMSHEHSIKTPIVYLVVGTLLIFLPSSVHVATSTFWAEPAPYGYVDKQESMAEFLNSIILVVQLFGCIAFIRGLVYLSKMGGSSGQPAFGKAMTHIIGGVLCINIYPFVKVILVTLGVLA